jgi:hypothetical protein
VDIILHASAMTINCGIKQGCSQVVRVDRGSLRIKLEDIGELARGSGSSRGRRRVSSRASGQRAGNEERRESPEDQSQKVGHYDRPDLEEDTRFFESTEENCRAGVCPRS